MVQASLHLDEELAQRRLRGLACRPCARELGLQPSKLRGELVVERLLERAHGTLLVGQRLPRVGGRTWTLCHQPLQEGGRPVPLLESQFGDLFDRLRRGWERSGSPDGVASCVKAELPRKSCTHTPHLLGLLLEDETAGSKLVKAVPKVDRARLHRF